MGAAPTFPLGTSGASLEVGISANFVSADFYQRFDGSDGNEVLVSEGRTRNVTQIRGGLSVFF